MPATTQLRMTWHLVHQCSKLVAVSITERAVTARPSSRHTVITVKVAGMVLVSMNLGTLTYLVSRVTTTCRVTTIYPATTAHCLVFLRDHGTDLESRSLTDRVRITEFQGFRLRSTNEMEATFQVVTLVPVITQTSSLTTRQVTTKDLLRVQGHITELAG